MGIKGNSPVPGEAWARSREPEDSLDRGSIAAGGCDSNDPWVTGGKDTMSGQRVMCEFCGKVFWRKDDPNHNCNGVGDIKTVPDSWPDIGTKSEPIMPTTHAYPIMEVPPYKRVVITALDADDTWVRLHIGDIPNKVAREVITGVLPEVLNLWLQKCADYGGDAGDAFPDILGAKGSFADIWRKVWKLKRSLWDGEQLKFEQPREIMMDLIGTLLLTLRKSV